MDDLAYLIISFLAGGLYTCIILATGYWAGKGTAPQSPKPVAKALQPTTVGAVPVPAPTPPPTPQYQLPTKPANNGGRFVMSPDKRTKQQQQEDAAIGELLTNMDAEV